MEERNIVNLDSKINHNFIIFKFSNLTSRLAQVISIDLRATPWILLL